MEALDATVCTAPRDAAKPWLGAGETTQCAAPAR